jgi:hypothetical protein
MSICVLVNGIPIGSYQDEYEAISPCMQGFNSLFGIYDDRMNKFQVFVVHHDEML